MNLEPGQIVGNDFQVIAPLSQGGMGRLFTVLQLSTGKKRALKVMAERFADDEKARARFTQEAKIGAQVESEHVVDVIAAGITDQGSPWLVMELLEGCDLSVWIEQRGPLSHAEARFVLDQLCHALEAAHRRGIVHRDLKPENIFIAQSRLQGIPFTVKVLDFGIARILEEHRSSGSTHPIGSPLWMAPEQADLNPVSPATDVWALGLITFYILTGKVFWRSAHAPELRLTSLFTEILVTPIESASARAYALGASDRLSPDFDRWFGRCVARDPKERWASAAVALAHLGPGFRYLESPVGLSHTTLLSDAPPVPQTMIDGRVPGVHLGANSAPPGAGFPVPSGFPGPGGFASSGYGPPRSPTPQTIPSDEVDLHRQSVKRRNLWFVVLLLTVGAGTFFLVRVSLTSGRTATVDVPAQGGPAHDNAPGAAKGFDAGSADANTDGGVLETSVARPARGDHPESGQRSESSQRVPRPEPEIGTLVEPSVEVETVPHGEWRGVWETGRVRFAAHLRVNPNRSGILELRVVQRRDASFPLQVGATVVHAVTVRGDDNSLTVTTRSSSSDAVPPDVFLLRGSRPSWSGRARNGGGQLTLDSD